MAIWISWNIDIGRSLNSRDSFPRRKFKNRALTSCSPGPILPPSTVSFELHAKTPEEIDVGKCNFRNFRSSVTLTLTLNRVEVTLVRTSGREKTCCGTMLMLLFFLWQQSWILWQQSSTKLQFGSTIYFNTKYLTSSQHRTTLANLQKISVNGAQL